MFEITYKENALPGALIQRDKAVYDFTFEKYYQIYHRPRKDTVEYICYDSRTNRGSRILERKVPLVQEEHILIIPDILKSLRYTGDRRSDGGLKSPESLIELIFRAILPRHGYAIREPQIKMAKTICHGLSHKRVTLCEAEVGSGKTMAYLVAGFAAMSFDQSYRFQGYPVTITTSSIELQKAIMEKELPALSAMLMDYGLIGKPLTAVLRKGKDHYFCAKRYHDYMDSLQKCSLLYSKTIKEIKALKLEKTGFDLDAVPLTPYVKDRICVNGSCQGCRRARTCRYTQFLDDALDPYRFDFQITNHNLFLTSQKGRNGSTIRGGLLPFNFCIVDEAHKFPETATEVFTARLSLSEVDDYLRSIKYNTKDKDPNRRAEYSLELMKAIRLNNRFQSMFDHYKFSDRKEAKEVKIRVTTSMQETIEKLIASLSKLGGWFLPKSGNSYNTASPILEKLTAFLAGDRNTYWITYDKATKQKYLCSIPTNLDLHMQKALWCQPNTHYALTSGTMRDDSGFSFFKTELGIANFLDDHSVIEYNCDSPFQFDKNTRLYISENVPSPAIESPLYIPAVANEVVRLIRATHGHTAVLFTSYKTLTAVYDLVAQELAEYPLFMMSRKNRTAISQFKQSKNGVLFASGSMWEGVDCPGDILSSVIIVRLPFPLRSHSLENRLTEYGSTKEFINQYAVPKMIIKLRQGAGRLIRTETDTGVLAILDARAAHDGKYRSRVLAALSKYPLVSSVKEVAEYIDSVKDCSYRGEVTK